MMLLIIDTTGANDSDDFKQFVQLDGREYIFRLIWSIREMCWYLNVYDQDENDLAMGIKLVVNFPVLRRFRDARLPPGVLFVGDAMGTSEEILQPIDLLPTGRCPLLYLTQDDEALTG